ncbi:hypothetical protein GCM10010912_27140 [Paenibacillus albidus]|uniref:Preprotein translocase subunit Tim44 n=2 Tax=Paenibacillus albidus TaxID=2041023 RepID=A0A917FHZ6_9BACL|nr:hypothetical protein [Paenibacillus albidus]GGF80579.1 hypothetical protein GCM10010912_27140 [Paenibacillus albidus]
MKPMKRVLMIVMAFTLFFAVTAPDFADARRGGFKSGTRSFTTTPKKATTNNNVKQSDSTKGTAGSTAGTVNSKRGFFSGGSLLKGMMIGGLAGLLFGSMFAGMGALGSFLGFVVNMLAIYLVVVLAMSFFRRRKERRRLEEQHNRY